MWSSNSSSGYMDKNIESKSFPGGSVVKNPPANVGDAGDVSVIVRWARTPGGGIAAQSSILLFLKFIYFLLDQSSILAWKSHGQRSLAGYSPWGCRESDTTEPACIGSKIAKRLFHTHVHSSRIHNSQKVKAPQASTDRWMDNQMWSIHTMENHSALERELRRMPQHRWTSRTSR